MQNMAGMTAACFELCPVLMCNICVEHLVHNRRHEIKSDQLLEVQRFVLGNDEYSDRTFTFKYTYTVDLFDVFTH